MTTGWPTALVSLGPAVSTFVGHPRSSARSAVFLAVAAAGAAALYVTDPGITSLVVGGWSVLGGAFSLALTMRTARDFAGQTNDLGSVRARRQQLAKELGELKRVGAQTEREHKETLALYGLIKGLANAMKWADVKPTLESAVDQYLGVADYALYIADPKNREGFRLLTARRLDGSPGASWATLERCLQERGLAAGEAHRLDAPEKAVTAPVLENGELVGYFYARAPHKADLDALLSKAQSFASEISFAFRRLRLFQEVENLSQIDGLTGVYRRGDFDTRLEREAVRAKTFKTTFGLMLLDIDHFKGLNDRYGHPFGDQVLKRVGEILNTSVYDTDFVARYGGEEFVVLLPRAQPEGAARKAEMIRMAIEAEKFQLGFETVRVTVSIGIAHFPRDAGTPEELVAEADAAMYEAKSRGRNQVVDSWAIRHSS